jgi:hypothetical protein
MEQRGRIFQDDNFVFTEFNGLKLQKVVVCENPETNEPILVYLKVENNYWHKYFLDAGIGFWETWNEIDIDSDDGYNYIDKTNEFALFEKIISRIWCEPQQNNSQIIIEFESSEKLILRTVQPEIFDSESELLKVN